MNHGYYQDRLSAYFDQALTGEEMQMIKEHLTSCAECRARLDDLARLDSLIEDKAGLGESDYWETAARKIEDRLTVAEESKVTVVRSGWFGLGWKLAAAAASIAALTFVALHEGEIRDTAIKSDESSGIGKTSPRTIMAPPTPDTGLLEARDEIDAVGMTDESEVTPESAAEPDARKAAPSDEPAAPPPVDVSAESDVITELKDAEAAGRGVDKKQKAPSKSEDVTSALEADEQPAESVDELLESGAGVVTDADGDVFIRGGRAGEVVYIVDSAPPDSARKEVADTYLTTSATDSLRYTLDLGLSRDVDGPLDFPGSKEAYQNYPTGSIDLSDIAVIPPEAEAKPDTTKSLDDWRAVRDSLQPYFADKQLVYGLRAQKSIEATDGSASPPASPAPVVDTVVSPRQLERYLEACYKIAELTDRESEYDSALVVIEKHARDRYSPARHRARHYLDLIDELQE